MRKILAGIAVLVALSGMVSAQTATPTPTPTSTPHPGALYEGLYRFIDLSAPSISLSGSWAISGSALRTTVNGASVSVPVVGQWLILSTISYGSETYEICWTTCQTYLSSSTTYPGIALLIPNGSATVTVRKINGTAFGLDRLWIMQGYVAPVDPAASGTPLAAPAPYVMFIPVVATAQPNSLDNPVISATLASGQTTTLSLSTTAGDIHIANLMLALLLSIWGMFLIAFIAAWQRK